MKKCGVVILTIAFSLVVAHSAQAVSLTVFNNEASFLTAAGSGLNELTFDGLGNTEYQTYDSGNGVTFSSNNSNPNAIFIAPAGFSADITSDSLFGNYYASLLIATFSPYVTAVGSELISWPADSTLNVTILDDLGATGVYSVTANPGYFAVIAYGGSIQNITYAPGSSTVGVDNFLFGQAQGVPEPSTMLLLGSGLLGLVGLNRRRRALQRSN